LTFKNVAKESPNYVEELKLALSFQLFRKWKGWKFRKFFFCHSWKYSRDANDFCLEKTNTSKDTVY
jgi:hypothetical protein